MKTEIQRHSLIKGNEYTARKICFCTRYVGRCQVMEEYGNYNRAMKPSRRNKKPRNNVLPRLIFNLVFEIARCSQRTFFATRAFINSDGYYYLLRAHDTSF